MTILFLILIIIASIGLTLIVLVQNPKGGGLAGNIAGFSSQFMGVKQTNDVLEKGTWIFSGIIAVLCLVSVLFIPTGTTAASTSNKADEIGNSVPSQPKSTAPAQNTVPVAPVPPAK